MDVFDNDFANIAFNLTPFMVWKQYQFQSTEPLSLKEVAFSVGLNYHYLNKVVNGKAAISLKRFETFYRFLYLNLLFQKMK